MSPLINLFWKRCPKDVFVGRSTLEIGVSSAVISFNNGAAGMLMIFDKLNLMYGKLTAQFCIKKDNDRISVMERKSKISPIVMRKFMLFVGKFFL